MNIAKTFRVGYSYVAYKYTKYNKGNSGKKGSGNKNPKDNNSYSDVSFDGVVKFNHQRKTLQKSVLSPLIILKDYRRP